jgi:hypothetical protein
MKIRHGFVSNSSSSSFICTITGESHEQYDETMLSMGFGTCEAGHTIPLSMFPVVEAFLEKLREEGTEEDEDIYQYEDPVLSPEMCPVCNGSAKTLLLKRFKKDFLACNLTKEDALLLAEKLS